MMHRRSLLTGLVSLAAAPAIVRAESLMKLPKRLLIPVDVEIGLTIQPAMPILSVGTCIYQGDRLFGVITAIGKGGEFFFTRENGDALSAAINI